MEGVGGFPEAVIKTQTQSVETRTSAERGHARRYGIDAHVVPISASVEIRDAVRSNLGNVQQEVLVCHLRQACSFLLDGHPWEVVLLGGVRPRQISLRPLGEGCLCEEVRPRNRTFAGDE